MLLHSGYTDASGRSDRMEIPLGGAGVHLDLIDDGHEKLPVGGHEKSTRVAI